MPERWRRELAKLDRVEPEPTSLRDRAEAGPRLPEPSASSGARIAAAVVALAVAVAAIGFAVVALRDDGSRTAAPDPSEVCAFTSRGAPEFVKLDSLGRELPRTVLEEPGVPASELGGPGAEALRAYLGTPAAVNAPATGWRVLIEEPGAVTFGAPFDDGGRWFVVGFQQREQGGWRLAAEMLDEEVPTDAQRGSGLRLEWAGPLEAVDGELSTTLAIVNGRDDVWEDAGGEFWAFGHVFDRETGRIVTANERYIYGVGTDYRLAPGERTLIPVDVGDTTGLEPGDYDLIACIPDLALATPLGTLRVLPPGTGPDAPDVTLLRSSEDLRTFMTALGGGVLSVREGCLGVEDPEQLTFVVWPPGWRLLADDGGLTLVDAIGEPVARVGDRITFGGGYMHLDSAEELVQEPIPEPCRVSGERYFLTSGEIVEVLPAGS